MIKQQIQIIIVIFERIPDCDHKDILALVSGIYPHTALIWGPNLSSCDVIFLCDDIKSDFIAPLGHIWKRKYGSIF